MYSIISQSGSIRIKGVKTLKEVLDECYKIARNGIPPWTIIICYKADRLMSYAELLNTTVRQANNLNWRVKK